VSRTTGVLVAIAAFLVVVVTVSLLWILPLTLMGPEPGEREAQLRADSTLRAAELTVARARIDSLVVWIAEANARFHEACELLPMETFDSCVAIVEHRMRREGKLAP